MHWCLILSSPQILTVSCKQPTPAVTPHDFHSNAQHQASHRLKPFKELNKVLYNEVIEECSFHGEKLFLITASC